MKRCLTRLLGPLAAMAVMAGCGQTDSPDDSATDAEQTAAATEARSEPAPAAEDSTDAPEARALRNPVPFERLMPLLPEPAGWTRSENRGHEVSEPMRQSVVESRFERGNVQVDLAITDTGHSPVLLAPYEMFVAPGFEERASDGLTRATRIGGAPAFERWSDATRAGEVVVIVADRFVVRASSTTAPSLAAISSVVSRVDIGRLGALR